MADIDFTSYPVSSLFPALTEAWSSHSSFILRADPGAGKSTMVPLFLKEKGLVSGKIIVLEPRRMAARSLARYMSSLLGVPTGQSVGYRVRGDVKCSYSARIELVTEGVFVRMIQDDPFLEG
ncbi:MAG: ATP-dependent helicase, partial [Spirochaetales bacterium]|nr:ATP-dependent helicase [Spirochaetales bacterium]